MAATKKHKHVFTRSQLRWSATEYIPEALLDTHRRSPIFSARLMEKWRRQVGRNANRPKHRLAYPTNNGINDPVTLALVADALLRIEPDAYVTASGLTEKLVEYDQVIWDSVTVGRILAEIYRFGRLFVGESRPHPPFPGWSPFDKTQQGSLKTYIIANDEVSRLWFGKIREHFGNEAIDAIEEYVDRGHPPARDERVWFPLADFKWGEGPEENE